MTLDFTSDVERRRHDFGKPESRLRGDPSRTTVRLEEEPENKMLFTILSGYYSRESKALLELNYELVRAMNPSTALPWLVVNNTPLDYGGEHLRDDYRFKMLPGAKELEPEHIIGYHGGKTPSCEHGVVLNNYHHHVKTRFALILDNDFFIIRKNWIRDVLEHMDKNDIAFFGSPFHPRQYHKLRYLPCPQLFFVDTLKVPLSSLNFLPQCDFKKGAAASATRHAPRDAGRSSLVRRLARRIFGAPDKYNYHYNPFSPRERGMIEGSRDTGTRIFEEYRDHSRIKSECLQPTWKPWREGGQSIFSYAANRAIEAFLPDRYCFIPKRTGYFTTKTFKDRGAYDVQGIDEWWEELVWKNEPFGFHLRQNRTVTHHGLESDLALVRKIIGNFSVVE